MSPESISRDLRTGWHACDARFPLSLSPHSCAIPGTAATLEVVAHITVCNGQERSVINSYRHAAPKRPSTRSAPRRPNLGIIWSGDATDLIGSRRDLEEARLTRRRCWRQIGDNYPHLPPMRRGDHMISRVTVIPLMDPPRHPHRCHRVCSSAATLSLRLSRQQTKSKYAIQPHADCTRPPRRRLVCRPRRLRRPRRPAGRQRLDRACVLAKMHHSPSQISTSFTIHISHQLQLTRATKTTLGGRFKGSLVSGTSTSSRY